MAATTKRIRLHLDPDRRRDMQELLMARQRQLKQRIESEQQVAKDELRDRLRLLAEFTNSINGDQTDQTDQGLPAISHTVAEGTDSRRLKEELFALHTILRPKVTLDQSSISLQEIATRLIGWVHRSNVKEHSPDIFFTDPTGYE